MSGKRSFCRKNDELMQNQEPVRHSVKMCAKSFIENTPDIWDMLKKKIIRRP